MKIARWFSAVIATCLLFGSVSCKKEAALQDGTYTGVGSGRNGDITVQITVADGKIFDAKIVSQNETPEIGLPAEDAIIAQFKQDGSTKNIDAVTGATLTSDGVLDALDNAVAAARGEKKADIVYKNTTCDIVIIGAGGAGLVAATEAASKGAHVIVLEKMGIVGGNTNYSIVDWLQSDLIGADLSDVGIFGGATNKRIHRPQGGSAIGAHLVPLLHKAALKQGADIRLNNKVIDILSDNGKASGARVSTANGEYVILAKAVIIASGGFGANPAMVTLYNPSLEGFGTTNHKGATGDAFAMVEKFDAALTQMAQIQTHPTVVPRSGVMLTEAVRGNGAILVSRTGKRFVDEMETRDVVSAAMLAEPEKTAFLVFDQSVRDSLKVIETYAKQGLLVEGATIPELAEKAGIEPKVLKDTIDRYNGFVQAGEDKDFHRNPTSMERALATAPFFAVECGPAIHHTMGETIPALFAAGEVTGGVHGGNRLGGNAVADICVFGKIAADSALAYIGK